METFSLLLLATGTQKAPSVHGTDLIDIVPACQFATHISYWHIQWRNRHGQNAPWHFSLEIFADLPGKEGQGKKGKWRGKEGKLEEGRGGNLNMEGGKLWKWVEDLFIFLGGSIFHTGKKIRKSDFAISGKYSCYATGHICKWLPYATFLFSLNLIVMRYTVQLTSTIQFGDIVTILQSCVFINKRSMLKYK